MPLFAAALTHTATGLRVGSGNVSTQNLPVTVSIGREHYAADIEVGGHKLRADEPTALGGTDTGPTPYGYLLAALGGCTAITLRMYADRKQWPLERVVTRLTHERIHARDCGECESTTGRVDILELELELHGDLDDEQREKLLDIAHKCPVHQTLITENIVRIRVVRP